MEHNWKVVAQCSWVNIFQSGHPCCSLFTCVFSFKSASVCQAAHITQVDKRFPVLSKQYVMWRSVEDICFSLRGWYLLIPSLSRHPGRISDLFGRGGESLQLKGTKRERGGDKKFDLISFPRFSPIRPRDELLQLLQNYSVHMHVTQSDMGGRCLEISCW